MMINSFVGILFTFLVSFVIGIFSFLTFTSHYKINSRYAGPVVTSFALFWLGMAGSWFSIACMDLLRYLKYDQAAIVGTYCLQTFIGVSLVVGAYFVQEILFMGRKRKTALTIYGMWCLLFIMSLFSFNVEPQPQSYFAAQIISSPATLGLFIIGFFPLWVGAVIYFKRLFLNNVVAVEPVRRSHMLMAASLILIGLAGAPDEMGIVYGWMVTATRLVTLIASIMAFMSIGVLKKVDDLVIE